MVEVRAYRFQYETAIEGHFPEGASLPTVMRPLKRVLQRTINRCIRYSSKEQTAIGHLKAVNLPQLPEVGNVEAGH